MAEKPYIATKPLFVGLHRAHNIGDEVPEENVKPNGWEDGVAREGTKAADEPGVPPRAGAGSGVDAWRTYATGLGVEVPEDASRDDIIALVDAHSA